MKKLILHIGMHKTGTTCIQNYLHSNRRELESQNFFYPNLRPEWFNHNPLAWSFVDSRYWPPNDAYYRLHSRAEYWDEVRALIDASPCSTAILSGEDFCLVRDPKQIKDICSGYEVRILIYLRRQDHYIESLYNQDVKDNAWQCIQTIEEYCANLRTKNLLDYEHYLQRWVDVFSPGSIDVGVFDKASLKHGLIRDVTTRIGINPDTLHEVPKTATNKSLSRVFLEFKRALNMSWMNEEENNAVLEAMQRCEREEPAFAESGVMPLALRTALLREYKSCNAAVAEKYLGGRQPLFSLPESRDLSPEKLDAIRMAVGELAPLFRELLNGRLESPRIRHSTTVSKESRIATEEETVGSIDGDAFPEVIYNHSMLSAASARLLNVPETAQNNVNMYSMSNWSPVYLPLLQAIRPRRIVEIGMEYGGNTAILRRYCIKNGVELHSVDVMDNRKKENAHPLISFYKMTSQAFLKTASPAEVYFVDADHNYASVREELELICLRTEQSPSPLVILDDTGWPCGYRDAFYDKQAEHARPISTTRGPLPWDSCLRANGFGAEFFAWDTEEGGERNGIRAAIEDFVAAHEGWGRLYASPFYGVCFLWRNQGLKGPIRDALEEVSRALRWAEPIFATLEWNRLLLYIQLQLDTKKMYLQRKSDGELWKKQQDWIKHLEEKLKRKATGVFGNECK